jgi:general control protein GCN4
MGTASTQDLHVRDPPPDEQLKVGQSPLRPLPTANPRRRSGTTTSLPSGGTSSSVSGIPSRKRDKPLPEINVEKCPSIAAKKTAMNTIAARKSRGKKEEYLRKLEERVATLEKERDHWKSIASEGNETIMAE